MATPTFYHFDLCASDGEVELSVGESSHALKSRRLRVGQQLNLINGRGLKAACVISNSNRHTLTVNIVDVQQCLLPTKSLTVAAAIPKADRQRTMIDILTQQGVTQIIALECEYSVTRWNNKLLAKWHRIAVAACKQSHNPWLPEMQGMSSVSQIIDWLDKHNNPQCVYADIGGLKMTEVKQVGDHLVILIGPEGGFSQYEIELLNSAGIRSISLAKTILRTESAAISAAAQYFLCK